MVSAPAETPNPSSVNMTEDKTTVSMRGIKYQPGVLVGIDIRRLIHRMSNVREVVFEIR